MPEVRRVSIFYSVRSARYPINTNLTESYPHTYFLLSHKRIIILRTMEIIILYYIIILHIIIIYAYHSYFQVIGNCKYMFCKNFSRSFLT